MYELGKTVPSSLLVSPDGSRVFASTIEGKLHAVTVVSGERKWLCELDGEAGLPSLIGVSPDVPGFLSIPAMGCSFQ